MIELFWDEFKTISGPMKMVELSNQYLLSIDRSPFSVSCILNKSNAQEFETSYKARVNIPIGQSPFASNVLGGKKLYKRVHGIRSSLSVGSNSIIFLTPHPSCKITGVEIIGGTNGDTINLKILDTSTGTVSTVPNYMLNQFGFNVNIASGAYEHKSEYEADLFQGLQVLVEYSSVDAKTVGINFILNEVK